MNKRKVNAINMNKRKVNAIKMNTIKAINMNKRKVKAINNLWSTFAVASSTTSILFCLNKALAKQINCFSPIL